MEKVKPDRPGLLSSEAYIAFEENATIRHELHNGHLVDMAGGTFNHSRIASNVNRQIGNRLEGKPSVVLNGDLRVRIGKTVNYYYPDVSVVCGSPQFDPPDRRITLVNPELIVEVVSESTGLFDRREKFQNYMRVDSLREYVLIDQVQPCVDTFYRQADGVWAIGPSYEGLESIAMLRLQGGIQLPLPEIYSGVEWLSSDASAADSHQP